MHEIFARRFDELEAKRAQIPWERTYGGHGLFVPDGAWKGWATSVQSLLRAVFGENSEQYTNFSTALRVSQSKESSVRTMFHIFASAKDDFEGGYVFNVELRVSGEIFGDFVVLARTALDEGNKDVAGVLACAALEDALKRFAIVQGLEVGEKTMTEVVNALKGAGQVSGFQKTLLERMPAIRNSALHANWEKITETDVGSVLGFVEQFLATKFSN